MWSNICGRQFDNKQGCFKPPYNLTHHFHFKDLNLKTYKNVCTNMLSIVLNLTVKSWKQTKYLRDLVK